MSEPRCTEHRTVDRVGVAVVSRHHYHEMDEPCAMLGETGREHWNVGCNHGMSAHTDGGCIHCLCETPGFDSRRRDDGPEVDRLARGLHHAMCDVSHHDRDVTTCSRWAKYPNIARSTLDAMARELAVPVSA